MVFLLEGVGGGGSFGFCGRAPVGEVAELAAVFLFVGEEVGAVAGVKEVLGGVEAVEEAVVGVAAVVDQGAVGAVGEGGFEEEVAEGLGAVAPGVEGFVGEVGGDEFVEIQIFGERAID